MLLGSVRGVVSSTSGRSSSTLATAQSYCSLFSIFVILFSFLYIVLQSILSYSVWVPMKRTYTNPIVNLITTTKRKWLPMMLNTYRWLPIASTELKSFLTSAKQVHRLLFTTLVQTCSATSDSGCCAVNCLIACSVKILIFVPFWRKDNNNYPNIKTFLRKIEFFMYYIWKNRVFL